MRRVWGAVSFDLEVSPMLLTRALATTAGASMILVAGLGVGPALAAPSSTGAVTWATDLAPVVGTGLDATSVAAGKGVAFAGTSTGVVVAADAATGLPRWMTDLTGGAGSPVEVSGVAFGKDVVVAGTSTGG
ncbi:outer membrane protein assembly factor BamB family protein, partial [Agromyces binzhouensis]|uniref:outer membrane protein assembly factor BamB family protein n=1 Tax=Agromyces binzhouensis TaxID=1817495 RepID=UPI00364493AD